MTVLIMLENCGFPVKVILLGVHLKSVRIDIEMTAVGAR
jgi:hypothetical protein